MTDAAGTGTYSVTNLDAARYWAARLEDYAADNAAAFAADPDNRPAPTAAQVNNVASILLSNYSLRLQDLAAQTNNDGLYGQYLQEMEKWWDAQDGNCIDLHAIADPLYQTALHAPRNYAPYLVSQCVCVGEARFMPACGARHSVVLRRGSESLRRG